MEDGVIITAALSGATTMKEQNPAVPYTPEEFAREAQRCFEEGAAVVHIHAREPDTGRPTSEPETVRRIVEGIESLCPLVINLSTGVRFEADEEERIRHVRSLRPEIASLNTNTMNMSFFRRKTGELLEDHVFYNSFSQIIRYAGTMRELGVKPELEVYDLGHVYNVRLLQRRKLFDEPMHFNFVMGVAGGIWFDVEHVCQFLRLIPPGSTWCATGIGESSFPAAAAACLMGGHVRVGLEDNVWLEKGTLARGNWELVRKAAGVARALGRSPLGPDEARAALNLAKKK
ncbi:MAG: 3-keto-5-aminohexanoate cleavage protein [bacterium]